MKKGAIFGKKYLKNEENLGEIKKRRSHLGKIRDKIH